ncbi:MAG: hypothetical protein KGO82_14945 [Bacteroidota bacterium]|nr:hypothetical protein [Bacteroidota bacterium]
MDNITIIIGVAVLIVLLILYFYFYKKDTKSIGSQPLPAAAAAAPANSAGNTHSLQLAAYERLVILAERIAIPNLLSRTGQPGLDKTQMQQLLTQTIRQEFEHNLSQQIYVSSEAWDAIRSLKDQNIHLINQVASVLPPEATGLDLSKKVLDFVLNQPQGPMHNLVQDLISGEAKKLLH